MSFLFAFIVSLVVTMMLIPPLMKWADRIGAIDIPDARKVHTGAIPRVGGIAMLIGSSIAIALGAEIDYQVLGILGGFLILLFFGVWDDRTDLDYRLKFVGQILAVLSAVLIGDVVIRNVPFFLHPLPDYIAVPFTVITLVGVTNAINLSDGLDGLAGGTTLLALSLIALLAFQAHGELVLVIAMAMSGSIFGFLRHNTYPAQLFMGDTGSQFLGFGAGVLAVMLTQSTNPALSPVLPLMILGLPILDTIAVMGQRIYEKRSPFSPDKNHIHHKLLDLGFDHYEAVLIIYIIQAALMIGAYLLQYESDVLILSIYGLFSVGVLSILHFSMKYHWRFHMADTDKASGLTRIVKKLRNSGVLTTAPMAVLKYSVPLVFIITFTVANTINNEFVVLSLVLVLILLVSWAIYKGRQSFIEKAVGYIICVMSVYFIQNTTEANGEYGYIINGLFYIIAISFVVKIRFSTDKSFSLTPMDFLVVSLVLVVPNVPGMGFEEDHTGEMAIKLVILFYAIESLFSALKNKINLLRFSMLASLSIYMIRGFL